MSNKTAVSYKEDNAFMNLIEEAEKIIAANRRSNNSNEVINTEQQVRELATIREELDNFLAPTVDDSNSYSSTSIDSMPISTNSSSLPSVTIENNSNSGNDDDVLLISDISNTFIPIVDLCTPVNENHLRRRRHQISNDDIIEIDDYIPLTKTTAELKSPKTKKSYTSPTNNDNKTNMIICPICLESTVSRHPKSTKCGHVFCWECITKSLKVSKKCPICKRQCSEKQLIALYL